MLVVFKMVKRIHHSEKDWVSTGVMCSLYLELFTIILGAVFGMVAAMVPSTVQKYLWPVLAPIGKVALYGGVVGLVFFASVMTTRNIIANIRVQVKKRRRKKLDQR